MRIWISLFIGTILIAFALIVNNYGVSQNALTSTLNEIKPMLQSSSIGNMRTNKTDIVDPKELVSNLVAEIVKEQKKHGHNVEIDYAFIDSEDNVTDATDDDIKSIQFLAKVISDKGKVKAEGEKRVSLNKEGGWQN